MWRRSCFRPARKTESGVCLKAARRFGSFETTPPEREARHQQTARNDPPDRPDPVGEIEIGLQHQHHVDARGPAVKQRLEDRENKAYADAEHEQPRWIALQATAAQQPEPDDESHKAQRNGRLVKVEARMVFDGGAYASTSSAVLINGVTHAQGPYRCENAVVDGYAVRTNNLPCGAMRGFGVVQACFAHEGQMDKLAAACGIDPVEIRLLNAMVTGDKLITGQIIENVAPVARCIRETAALPLPDEPVGGHDHDPMRLPGGAGRTADSSHIVRGIGFAVAIKNLMYSETFDDYSTARCRLSDGIVTLKFATSEVGQGFITIAGQIARSVLGFDNVVIDSIDTDVGSAGSTSASRQTWMSGGAVNAACIKVRDQLFAAVAVANGVDPLTLAVDGGDIVDAAGVFRISALEAASGLSFDETVEYHHKPTEDLDENGQGNCHTAFAFVAHRAVVDVDPELGLVKVIQIATAQDVGRALNPLSVIGQIEGGIAQGLGLAVMEEIIMRNGHVRNPSFTDYLLPTFLDMPSVIASLIEEPDPIAPLGAKGVGEPPTISSTPAIVAAIRDAIGKPLNRVPVRPTDIIGLSAFPSI